MDTQKQVENNLFVRIRNHRLSATFALLGVLSAGILAGSVLTRSVSAKDAVDSSDARPLVIPKPVDLSNAFSKIAKEVGPAVVNIKTEIIPKQSTVRRGQRRGGTITPPGSGDQGDMQDFFNRFFGGQGGQGGDDGSNNFGGGSSEARGTGFIVDSRGYIITNNHVVDKADKIYVKLSTDPDNDSEQGRPAHVIGVDAETDIAVIKIDAPNPLPTVKLGNSDGAQVGDWVLAIGEPFGLSQTVSAGIVSAKNRSLPDEEGPNGTASQFQRFIQTDAAINPGNSGGPLVDMAGEVIGMNTAIYTQSSGSEGVGFAMPANTIASVYNMLISPDHKVVRGSIGISFQPAESSAVTRVYGFANGGVQVNTVTPNGPAAKAGVKPDDVIVSIDGKPIKDGDALVADISSRKVGTTVQLGIQRSNGSKETLTVGIADRAKLFADLGSDNDSNSTPSGSDASESKLGIQVDVVPAQISSNLDIHGGVIVTSVRPGSFAEDVGIVPETVILEINKKPISDKADFNSIVNGLKSGQDVAFKVRLPGKNTLGGNTFLGGTLP